jgi:hypothetical protein
MLPTGGPQVIFVRKIMGTRIALLLNGFNSDLSAIVCAVQLADRTERRLYALQAQGSGSSAAPPVSGAPTESQVLDGFRFVSEFAGLEGVKVTCHLLGAGFLLANSVTCLVVGGWPEELRPAQDEWLGELRRQLREEPHRFYPDLLVIMAPNLAEADLERVVSQSRRLKQLAASKKN